MIDQPQVESDDKLSSILIRGARKPPLLIGPCVEDETARDAHLQLPSIAPRITRDGDAEADDDSDQRRNPVGYSAYLYRARRRDGGLKKCRHKIANYSGVVADRQEPSGLTTLTAQDRPNDLKASKHPHTSIAEN